MHHPIPSHHLCISSRTSSLHNLCVCVTANAWDVAQAGNMTKLNVLGHDAFRHEVKYTEIVRCSAIVLDYLEMMYFHINT